MARWAAGIAGLAALLGWDAARGAPPPSPTPGGPFDTNVTGAEVYVGVPQRAKRPAGKACAVAEAYVDHINSGRYRDAADLFADDGVLFEPSRRTYRGRAEIRTFYEGQIGGMRPEVVPVAYLGNDRECMVELAVKTAIGGAQRFALVSIDHFTLDGKGRVASMIAFPRPPRTQ